MKIEFYHVDAFEAANYEPIWRALRDQGVDARMVAVPGRDNTADADWFDFDRLAAYYRARGVPFVTAADHDAFAITTQNQTIIRHYRRPHMRLAYGPIMYPHAWAMQPIANEPFDVVLVHGPAYVDIYSRWKARSALPVVGYPRYDDFFSGRIDVPGLGREWGLDPARPTIAYLPTWGENSTFDAFFPHVAALGTRYNVIVRPHHCTLRFEPGRCAAMQRSGLLVLDNAYDLSALYAVADVILADTRSGALFEAFMAEKRSIGLVLDPRELDEWIHPGGVHELGPICTDPTTIARTVDGLLTHDPFATRRRAWADWRVSFRDGTAGRHAATAIVRTLEAATPRTLRSPGTSDHVPRASVILPVLDDLPRLPETITAFLQQTLADVELLVVDGGSTDGSREWLDGLGHPQVRVLLQEHHGRAAALTAGLKAARSGLLLVASVEDAPAPLLLEALTLALALEPGAAMAFASCGLTDAAGAILDVQHAEDVTYGHVLADRAVLGGFLFRRAALTGPDAGDEEMGDAFARDLWLRLAERHPYVMVPEVLAYRRRQPRADGPDAAFAAAVARNDGFRDLARAYPALAECADQHSARRHAARDLAAALAEAPGGCAPPRRELVERLLAAAGIDEAPPGTRTPPLHRLTAVTSELPLRERRRNPIRTAYDLTQASEP